METTASSQSAKSTPPLPSPTNWSGRRHLVDTKDLSLAEIGYLINQARKYKIELSTGKAPHTVLLGKFLANLFYETSTRTRLSFEIAGIHLGMNVLNLDVATSSVQKGETIEDTGATLAALGVNAIVQRHSTSGSAEKLIDILGNQISVINAGEGATAHPTQALLDLFTMLEIKDNLAGAKVAIVGDVKHSRVARSNLWTLLKAGAQVHFAGPANLMPADLVDLGAYVHTELADALAGADFVMALRIQLERLGSNIVLSQDEYTRRYRIDHKRLAGAKPSVKVLHPGPINRGVELTEQVADDPEISLITKQVSNGVPVRMSVISALCQAQNEA